MDSLQLREADGGVILPIRAKPRSGKNAVEGMREGSLMVSVRAAPADGEANTAIVATLAEALNCPKSAVQLIRGHKSRDKAVLIIGLSADDIMSRLEL